MYYPTQWLFLFYILAIWPSLLTCQDRQDRPRYSETSGKRFCADGERTRICVPADYIKFELPEDERPTYVKVGVDIKDIPKVNDKDFSITMNAYFIVKWQDRRLIVEKRNRTSKHFIPDSREILTSTTSSSFTSSDSSTTPTNKDIETYALHEEGGKKLTAVNLQILRNLWLPDVEILNLKAFETHKVLSKLEGVWLDEENFLIYALATRITFICPMKFNAFPMDIQRCKFQVGSFNYDMSKMVFENEFVPDEKQAIKSILDYQITIKDLKPEETHYMALGMNYSVAGFEMILQRKMSFYIVTYYLPSGLFVVVSWISFLVNPEVIPGRMTLLVTIFLVLINIFNTIQTNSPKAEGLTAIEAWVIACIIFVFGALGEYTVILLKLKLTKLYPKPRQRRPRRNGRNHNPMGPPTGMSATTALTTSAAAAAMPLTMMTTATTTTSAASANSEVISPTMSFSAFNLQSMQNANSLGHLSSRKDYYARTDLTFLVVFPLLFFAFNLCYWISLLYWRKDEEEIHFD